jgi:hypothetical protein
MVYILYILLLEIQLSEGGGLGSNGFTPNYQRGRVRIQWVYPSHIFVPIPTLDLDLQHHIACFVFIDEIV